jgi:hypothetical protein
MSGSEWRKYRPSKIRAGAQQNRFTAEGDVFGFAAPGRDYLSDSDGCTSTQPVLSTGLKKSVTVTSRGFFLNAK